MMLTKKSSLFPSRRSIKTNHGSFTTA
jgi:hypothetical protein